MGRLYLLTALVVLLLLPRIGESKSYRFDMGTKDSPVWEGFTQVTKDTAYTAELGYGWEKTAGLKDDARKAENGSRLRPDDLCGDFVYDIASPFLMDVPNGNYAVYLIIGDIGWSHFYPTATLQVGANGQEKFRHNVTARNYFTQEWYFRSKNKEWRKGDDIWEQWINPAFRPIAFTVQVTEKRLALSFSPECRLDCLIVYPVDEAASAEKELSAITAKRKAAFEARYVLKEPAREPFAPSPAQKAKGYVLFPRNYVDTVYPTTAPKPEEIGKELRIFAAQGETEPATFCVYPLKNLEAVSVECSPLTDDKGGTLSADVIEVCRVAYREVPYFMISDSNAYEILPFFLKQKKAMEYEAGVTRQVWLTIRIPENAAPSLYAGKIRFHPQNAEPSELDLKIRVLPFRLLDMPEDASFGFYYYLPDWLISNFPDPDKFWEMVARDYSLMKQYNATSALAGVWLPPIRMEAGKVVVDFKGSYIEKFMEVYQKVGMKAPLGWYHFTGNLLSACRRLAGVPDTEDFYGPEQFDNPKLHDIMKQAAAAFENHRKEQHWPGILYYLEDEYGARRGERGVQWAKRITAIYHEVPGMKVCGGVCNEAEAEMIPIYDIPLLNPVVLTAECVDKAMKSAKAMGFYNIGTHRINGFYFWKMNAKVHMQWNFATRGIVDPYNLFDSTIEPDLSVAYPSTDGPVPTIQMILLRESLDDYRYCHTLRRLIQQSKNSGKAEAMAQAARSQEVFDTIMSQIRPDYLWYTKEGSFPSTDVYDKLRWKVAQQIIKLNESLEK